MKKNHLKSFEMERIMQEYEKPLIRYALRFTRDLDQARDVVQDTLLRFWKSDDHNKDQYLAPWLFRVCRNRAIDLYRKDQHLDSGNDFELENVANSRPHPAQNLEHKQTKTEILSLLNNLPEKEQEVIRLKFQNGFSYKEISAITGLSVSHIGLLIHQAIKALREGLKPKGAPLTHGRIDS